MRPFDVFCHPSQALIYIFTAKGLAVLQALKNQGLAVEPALVTKIFMPERKQDCAAEASNLNLVASPTKTGVLLPDKGMVPTKLLLDDTNQTPVLFLWVSSLRDCLV